MIMLDKWQKMLANNELVYVVKFAGMKKGAFSDRFGSLPGVLPAEDIPASRQHFATKSGALKAISCGGQIDGDAELVCMQAKDIEPKYLLLGGPF